MYGLLRNGYSDWRRVLLMCMAVLFSDASPETLKKYCTSFTLYAPSTEFFSRYHYDGFLAWLYTVCLSLDIYLFTCFCLPCRYPHTVHSDRAHQQHNQRDSKKDTDNSTNRTQQFP